MEESSVPLPLPTYNIFRLAKEDPLSDHSLRDGCFNYDTLKGLRRKEVNDYCSTKIGIDGEVEPLNAYLDYEKLGPVYSQTDPTQAEETSSDEVEASSHVETSGCPESEAEEDQKKNIGKKKSLSEQLVENDNVVGSLKTLHGKLATADLNLKARKLEQSMSQKEREEEALIRKKQLESIYTLLATDKERFGVNDEADVFDQMKLYSFGR
ncbi:unnamed protein product [Enterobius vermicularis]|uniref:NAM-associated domain-containing protein n=1 Tax=Enterobius vermicularis TaxID=51028 RepID=A0A0N4V864_ENTVE|nr:unnamed protein product [Enterobius vermicularis]